MKSLVIVTASLFCLGLGACSEQAQTAGTRKSDQSPASTPVGKFTASGWTSGDKVSWENQMAVRAKTQNEYNRTGAH
ncbi:MAG: hypothetical protein ABL896_17315 [Hylemonella sp.]